MKIKHVTLSLVVGLMLVACTTGTPPPTATPVVIVPASTPTLEPTEPPTVIPPSATISATVSATATRTTTPTAEPPTPTSTPAYPTAGYGPAGFPANINPLTGLQVTDPTILQRRPLASKIDIVPRNRNRPPWGLSFADIVYDYYHNDGYSRFHAIFYGSDAELIGSIRSARLLDEPLVRMYKSLFVYGGADQRIDSRLLNSEFYAQLIREGRRNLCPPSADNPLCRFDPNGFNILLAGTKEIHALAQSKGISDGRQNLEGMFFQLAPPADGVAGLQTTSRYSTDSYTRWEYDAGTGLYLRFQDNAQDQGQGEDYAPLVDRLTDQQITAANVVVLLVQHEYFTPPPGEIVEILLNGAGTAYAFRDGQVYQVKWNRPTRDSVLYLTFADGSPFPFKPGNTWFQVMGQSSVIPAATDGAWRFDFRIP